MAGYFLWSAPRATQMQQGALSGGGFLKAIDISDDGLSRLITYDSANAWIWNATTSQWDNVIAQNRIPASLKAWGHSAGLSYAYTAYSLVSAPSLSTRLYIALFATPGAGVPIPGMIWRSNDRGLSWTDTGYTVPIYLPQATNAAFRGTGPLMAVDPNNPDVLYISDSAGVIHRTFDGGSTWEQLNVSGGALAGVLPTAAATVTASGTTLTFAATPTEVVNRAGYTVFPYNLTNRAAINFADQITGSTATTVTLFGAVSAAVQIGDIISFGSPACIAFDRSSGTTNGRTNGIYIGWFYAATAVYLSTNAGVTFAATTGGPARVRHMKCSWDGVLYACDNNSITETNTTNAWKYQSGTWTNFSISGSSGNVWASCSPDPLNAGHIAFVTDSGGFQMSGDYGTSWYPTNASKTRTAADVPWLGPYVAGVSGTIEDWMTHGSSAFDPVVSGRIWIVEGIGCWYGTPPVQGTTPTIALTSQNKNQQGLIVDQIIKPPGNPLVMVVQDRSGFQISSLTTEPNKGFQIGEALGAAITSGWGIDYAKSDPTFQVCIAGSNCNISSDSGNSWGQTGTQPVTSHVGGAIAAQSSTNFVWFPANEGTPVYTDDGGATWVSCLFDGSTLSTGWSFSVFNNRHIVVADLSSSSTYYAFNYSNNANGGVWRSTDGGINWVNMTGGIAGFLTLGSFDAQLISIPGFAGHLLLGYGSAFNNSLPMQRSIDGGATWSSVPGVSVCWQPAAGLAAPGASYPAIFFSGTVSGDSSPGIYRADDMSPSNVLATPTWWKVCSAPAYNMSTSKSLCADYEVYGKFYVGFGSTGYAWGQLV